MTQYTSLHREYTNRTAFVIVPEYYVVQQFLLKKFTYLIGIDLLYKNI